MPRTYSRLDLLHDDYECHDCGDPDATMLLVGDELEDGTGYQDLLALCPECWERRRQDTPWAV